MRTGKTECIRCPAHTVRLITMNPEVIYNMYEPKPIDTSDVVLPAELLALTEKIAENVHEVWAAGRIAEGWTYGEKKDNDLKTTPLLVPYDELAESEKEYDRNTALETLKLIVKMGYRIELRDPNQ